MMVYKISNRCDEKEVSGCENESEVLPKWRLWTKQSFSYPILAVEGWENLKQHKDNTHKSLTSSVLAVTTIKAIHILYYDKNA